MLKYYSIRDYYSTTRLLLADLFAFLIIYLVPTFSHWLAFPLYILEPMRIMLLFVYFTSRSHNNALLIALTIPLFSMMVSGHPVFYKSILISMELFLNILILNYLIKRIKLNSLVCIFISIVFSKVIYYGLKYLLIAIGLFDGNLVSTKFSIQLGVTAGLSIFFFLFNSLVQKNKQRAV
jgi:hypothetical protein